MNPWKVEPFDDLAAVAGARGSALDRSSQQSLFDRLSWFRLVAEHAPPPGQPLALRATSSGKDCWLFLALEGGRASAFANWYSLRFGAPGADRAGLAAIAGYLRRRRPSLHNVQLSPLDPEDPLPAAFQAAGWLTFVTPATVNWQIETDGMSFDSYWAGRSSKLRNTARRKAKAAALDIAIYDRFDAQAWADYEEVYRASWKPEEGSPPFMRALAEQEGAAGTLRLGIARKDGQPIAAQLWLVEGGRATIHKLAYVESAKELSPGTVLSVEMFRRALDIDKVRLIDFGTGNDPYKAEWMDRARTLNRMTAYNPATVAGLAGAVRATASKLVDRVRKP